MIKITFLKYGLSEDDNEEIEFLSCFHCNDLVKVRKGWKWSVVCDHCQSIEDNICELEKERFKKKLRKRKCEICKKRFETYYNKKIFCDDCEQEELMKHMKGDISWTLCDPGHYLCCRMKPIMKERDCYILCSMFGIKCDTNTYSTCSYYELNFGQREKEIDKMILDSMKKD